MITLNEDRNVFLSLGGGIRETYERFHNTNFGLGPDDQDGYLLQRHFFHVDLHAGQRFRFFGELNSSLEDGRTGGPRPLDEDKLDVHQGHRIGFPSAGRWREIFNSDVHECWMNFSVEGDDGAVYANDKMPHSPPSSAALTLPANSILIFARG